ncbi:hypothetical protein ARMSODRAFT_185662 [Armillaria solidipes]|uniref:Uncharacterized protein n=1 Tax=Armillaria solidipes TaxID=1076256 RepID=A0A2H3BNX6_9AGAR|nr:hypothetical protein ARMSODRAFT_185662 [Armillaria solidipes]
MAVERQTHRTSWKRYPWVIRRRRSAQDPPATLDRLRTTPTSMGESMTGLKLFPPLFHGDIVAKSMLASLSLAPAPPDARSPLTTRTFLTTLLPAFLSYYLAARLVITG